MADTIEWSFFLNIFLFDVADFPGLSLDAQEVHHLVALSIADSQTLLHLVLVLLDLTQVHVDYSHGMLADFGEGHHVVPVLQDELVAM